MHSNSESRHETYMIYDHVDSLMKTTYNDKRDSSHYCYLQASKKTLIVTGGFVQQSQQHISL